ncbi:12358_t:CDS:2 [Gigaspora rosea]|nr:12358_t:CDS:2 [Gigaspora rosea]
MKFGLFLFLAVFAIATLATPLTSGDSLKRQANRNMFCNMCAATCPESCLGGWNCTSCTSCS